MLSTLSFFSFFFSPSSYHLLPYPHYHTISSFKKYLKACYSSTTKRRRHRLTTETFKVLRQSVAVTVSQLNSTSSEKTHQPQNQNTLRHRQTVSQTVSHQSSDFSRSASVICFRPANTKFACTSIATTTTTRSVSSFSFFSFSSTSFPSCLLVQLH